MKIYKKEELISVSDSSGKVQDFLNVRFLGVRGTIPTPHPEFLKYGANTSCVHVSSFHDGQSEELWFDGGTGIVRESQKSLSRGVLSFHVFLSHLHYDHIFGLTQFAPFFRKDTKIYLYGERKDELSFKEAICGYFRKPYFPLEFTDLPCFPNTIFVELKPGDEVHLQHTKISCASLHHPQGALAYRVWTKDNSKSVVYATDHEHGTSTDEELSQFIHGADLVIYDCSFGHDTYPPCKGWGHSTSAFGAQLCKCSSVKRLGIFHHSPQHEDGYLEDVILKEATTIFSESFLTQEGLVVRI